MVFPFMVYELLAPSATYGPTIHINAEGLGGDARGVFVNDALIDHRDFVLIGIPRIEVWFNISILARGRST
jgi:hypothetical protein